MPYCLYDSPIGTVQIVSDGSAVTGLWLPGQGGVASFTAMKASLGEDAVLASARTWLDKYFDGEEPELMPPLRPHGTPFCERVWAILRTVPYGETTTYGEIARRLTERSGGRMSAQAVGRAVGANPIALMIPCHRVVGAGGALVGYAGGVDRKEYLLVLEKRGRPCARD